MEDLIFHVTASEWSEIVRNYALSIAAAATTWVAWQSLTSWKKQKTWEADREISRRLFLAATELDEAVVGLRICAKRKRSTAYLNSTTCEWKPEDERSAEIVRIKIEERILELDDALITLKSDMAEASVLWDDDEVYKVRRDIDILVSELNIAASSHVYLLKFRHLPPETKYLSDIDGRSLQGPHPSDEFATALDSELEKLKSHIKSRIGRPS